MHIYLRAWMLISNHRFHAVLLQQSSSREKVIGEIEKYSQKSVYVEIVYNTFCVDYICVF